MEDLKQGEETAVGKLTVGGEIERESFACAFKEREIEAEEVIVVVAEGMDRARTTRAAIASAARGERECTERRRGVSRQSIQFRFILFVPTVVCIGSNGGSLPRKQYGTKFRDRKSVV